ncbi:MAG: hypothetical protein FWD80_04505 [Propionibacteriaceae bacterium]|nr:hypothetical protein [Propionibacteriaceae bacterium]
MDAPHTNQSEADHWRHGLQGIGSPPAPELDDARMHAIKHRASHIRFIIVIAVVMILAVVIALTIGPSVFSPNPTVSHPLGAGLTPSTTQTPR